MRGWTQKTAACHIAEYLGEHWSKASFSVAERTVTGKRIKQFTADDIVSFAAAFGLPISFFFIPPKNATWIGCQDGDSWIGVRRLAKLATDSIDESILGLVGVR